jgi:NAD(P)-dependent dehydrogenase (short-subunit alcohol dehydrogenase family)
MKSVLITGIGKGLGRAFYNLLVERGYSVYGLLRKEADFNKLNTNKPENVKLILADVTLDDCIEKIKAVVKNERIDLLINNAGIGGEGMILGDVTVEEIAALFNVHCLGVFRETKTVINNLQKADAPVVVNLNSRLGSITHQNKGTFSFLQISYSYRIAKAAQNMLTNCFRLEFPNIKFVSLTPGKLITKLAQTDAKLPPEESARRIINFWEEGKFENTNGIIEVPDQIMEW